MRRKTSRYRGVSWNAAHDSWRVDLQAKGERHGLTGIRDERTAARLYDRLAVKFHGEKASLNFPREKPRAATVDQLKREIRSSRPASSRYRGVYHDGAELERRWSARIEPNGAICFLGRYETERQAAIAYDRAARYYFGEEAHLNLPAVSGRLAPADAETLVFESRQAYKAKTTSRFLGVSWNGFSWVAAAYLGKRSVHIGSFEVEEEAAEAYDRAVLKFRGKRAKLNFDPGTGEELLGRVLRRKRS